MIGRRGPPSQSWRTFLRNHADAIAAIDLCVVPTLTFERLFAFLVVGHGRRQLLWFAVTRNPSAEWLAQQMAEAFPWNTAPTYLVRDNDRAYGQAFQRRIRAMGIRARPISPRSAWQNPYAERLIGTLRRECLDHVLIVGERHLRRMLASYSSYYNESRTHLALEKDAPLRRAIQRYGAIITTPILFGLHHRYVRMRCGPLTGAGLMAHMRRRELIAALGGAAVAWPLAVRAAGGASGRIPQCGVGSAMGSMGALGKENAPTSKRMPPSTRNTRPGQFSFSPNPAPGLRGSRVSRGTAEDLRRLVSLSRPRQMG